MEFHWSVVLEYRDALLWGIVRTLQLSTVSAVLSLIIGIFIGILRTSRYSLFRLFGGAHVECFRNIPVVIHMMFFYFGLGFGSFWAGVIGLTLYSSGYIAETVRSGITSVSKGQIEAALSSGLSPNQVRGFVVLPQALMFAIPPLTTDMLNIVKNSSVAMAIAFQELTFTARQIEADTFRGFEAAAAVTILYIVLTGSIISGINVLEKGLGVRARLGDIGGRKGLEE